MPVLSSNACTIEGTTYLITADSYLNEMLPHKAFDGILSDSPSDAAEIWHSAKASEQGTHWLMVGLSKPVKVQSFTICNRYTSQANQNHNVKDFVFEGSNDGAMWISLFEGTCKGIPATSETFVIENSGYFTSYRLRILTSYSVYSYECYAVIGELQLQGMIKTQGSCRLTELIPQMAANIFQDDSGKEWKAIASTTHSAAYDNYMAFDGNNTSAWANGYEEGSTTVREVESWIGIKCPERRELVAYILIGGNSVNYPTEWILQGSNDGTQWTDIQAKSKNTELANKSERFCLLSESVCYQYYRLYIKQYAQYCLVSKFQLLSII